MKHNKMKSSYMNFMKSKYRSNISDENSVSECRAVIILPNIIKFQSRIERKKVPLIFRIDYM